MRTTIVSQGTRSADIDILSFDTDPIINLRASLPDSFLVPVVLALTNRIDPTEGGTNSRTYGFTSWQHQRGY
jgi:hypothetical protein